AFDGLTFTEAATVTTLHGGIAGNVIPDRAVAHVNYRYPPGMSAPGAEARLHAWCDPHGELVVDSNAPSAPVFATHPLVEALRAAEARGVPVIDLGVGEPREETPAFIRRALAAALEAEPVSTYPSSEGVPELREAIAAWVGRRFGAALDPDREVVPTLGSK